MKSIVFFTFAMALIFTAPRYAVAEDQAPGTAETFSRTLIPLEATDPSNRKDIELEQISSEEFEAKYGVTIDDVMIHGKPIPSQPREENTQPHSGQTPTSPQAPNRPQEPNRPQ